MSSASLPLQPAMKIRRLALAVNPGGALPLCNSVEPKYPSEKPIGLSVGLHCRSHWRNWVALWLMVFLGHAVAAIAPPISFAWNPSLESNVASYEVRYGTASGVYTAEVNVGNVASASIGGLSEGTTYYFVVSAINSAGLESPPSDEISVSLGVKPRVPLSSSNWTLLATDSQEAPTYSATMAFDGNPATLWHSNWSTSNSGLPHEIQIDLGRSRTMVGFSCLPRQDGSLIGMIGQCEFYVSQDGLDWGTPVATGAFSNNNFKKEVLFKLTTGRFVRLKCLTSANNDRYSSLAEFQILVPANDSDVSANRAPAATPKVVVVNENMSASFSLAGSDPDGDSINFLITGNPTHGKLTGTGPNLTYTPTSNFSGSDSFTFKVTDGVLDSADSTVVIIVNPVNVAPIANSDSIVTAQNTPIPIMLSGSDKEGSTLTYTILTRPNHGALTGKVPNLIYTPSAHFSGSDEFTFSVNDGALDSIVAPISITITPINTAPLAVTKSITTPAGTPTSITLTGSDAEGDALLFSIIRGPTHGTLFGTAPNLTYIPNLGYTGSDQFTYHSNDGSLNSDVASILIDITIPLLVSESPQTDKITIIPQTGWTLQYVDSEETSDAPGAYAFDGNPSTFWHTRWRSGSLPPPPHEIQINLGSVRSVTGFRYLPRQDRYLIGNIGKFEFFVSMDGKTWGSPVASGSFNNNSTEKEIIFTAKTGRYVRLRELSEANGGPDCCIAELNLLQGIAVNHPPVFGTTSLKKSATEDTPFSDQLLATDEDSGDSLIYSKISGPAWLSVSPSGAITGTPLKANIGTNTFVVKAIDQSSASTTTTLVITVSNRIPSIPPKISEPPRFSLDKISLSPAVENTAYIGQTLAGSATVSGSEDSLTYSKISGPDWLDVSKAGDLTGTPPIGSSGTQQFTIGVADAYGNTSTAKLQLDILSNGLPLPWSVDYIGSGLNTGATQYSAGNFTITGSGITTQTRDAATIGWQTLIGNGSITAKIKTIGTEGALPLIGITIRKTLAPNSPQVFLGVSSDANYRWSDRRNTGESAVLKSYENFVPQSCWVRLVRTATIISAFQSADGVNWQKIGYTMVRYPSNCYIGLSVSSGSESITNTSTFSNVSISR